MNQTRIDFGYDDIPREQKQHRVKGVFDSVARNYDRMNDAMSLGVHRVWKDMTITKMNPQPGERLIDCAGGTGDLARRFLRRANAVRERRGGPAASAVICDINAEMLHAGVDAKKDAGMDISRVCANAEALPFDNNSADAVCIAFGIRNVTDRDKALREFNRVLKPGGRFFCLEFSTPPVNALKTVYDAYSFAVIPRLGGLLADDKESYQYLIESIRRFPKQQAFANMVETAGFHRVGWQDYTGGIAALHWGWKV